MKHTYFLSIVTFLILSIGVVFSPVSSVAIDFNADSVEGAFQDSNSCPIHTRTENWDIFLTSVLSYDDFAEYWKDIFGRNMCQRSDIDSLLLQIDKTQVALRNAFYTCNDSQVNSLRRQYYDLEVELNYVRNVVLTDPETYGASPLNTRSDTLYITMREQYVSDKQWYDEKTFKALYVSLQQKYVDKISLYIDCPDVDWVEVQNKWDAFVINMQTLFASSENGGYDWAKPWNKVLRSPPGRAGQYLDGFFGVYINGQDPKKALSDIYQSLSEQFGNTSFTYSEINASISQENDRFSRNVTEAEMMSLYKTLYQQTSDAAVQELTAKARKLNQVVEDTLPILNSVAQCANTVSNKQCAE